MTFRVTQMKIERRKLMNNVSYLKRKLDGLRKSDCAHTDQEREIATLMMKVEDLEKKTN